MANLVALPLTRVVRARQLPDNIMVQVYKIITGSDMVKIYNWFQLADGDEMRKTRTRVRATPATDIR